MHSSGCHPYSYPCLGSNSRSLSNMPLSCEALVSCAPTFICQGGSSQSIKRPACDEAGLVLFGVRREHPVTTPKPKSHYPHRTTFGNVPQAIGKAMNIFFSNINRVSIVLVQHSSHRLTPSPCHLVPALCSLPRYALP